MLFGQIDPTEVCGADPTFVCRQVLENTNSHWLAEVVDIIFAKLFRSS